MIFAPSHLMARDDDKPAAAPEIVCEFEKIAIPYRNKG
jgi:hypothetical protein